MVFVIKYANESDVTDSSIKAKPGPAAGPGFNIYIFPRRWPPTPPPTHQTVHQKNISMNDDRIIIIIKKRKTFYHKISGKYERFFKHFPDGRAARVAVDARLWQLSERLWTAG